MGKRSISKRKGEQSLHSRAARRETSPSINTDKSLKDAKLPTEISNYKPSVLSVHRGAGIVKASKHSRKHVLSAKARRRQEKGLDRAEAILDRTALKVEKSKGKARRVQERRKAWEDLNKKMASEELSQQAPKAEKENMMQIEEDTDQEEEKSPHLAKDVLSRVGEIQIQSPPSFETTAVTSLPSIDDEGIL